MNPTTMTDAQRAAELFRMMTEYAMAVHAMRRLQTKHEHNLPRFGEAELERAEREVDAITQAFILPDVIN